VALNADVTEAVRRRARVAPRYAAMGDSPEAFPGASCQLHVSNIPFEMGEGALATIFAGVPGVVQAQTVVDKDTGKSKGFGFVRFEVRAPRPSQARVLSCAAPLLTFLPNRPPATRTPPSPGSTAR
jgi:hypothetical protein